MTVVNEIKLVKQKGFAGCGVACIAMVAGKEYDEVFKVADKFMGEDGMEDSTMDVLLRRYQVEPVRYNYPRMYRGRLYICVVPSLVNSKGLHYIVVDSRGEEIKVYDPQNGPNTEKYEVVDDLRSYSGVVECL